MNNFEFSLGTTVFFGKNQIEKIGPAIKEHASSVLLASGKSMFKLGIYDQLVAQFKELGITWVEFNDIQPNPLISSVKKGADLCKEHKLEAVIAVGGGSVIDCGKAIAASANYDGDPWDLVVDRNKIKKVLPIFAISTFASTGSEMDTGSIITNDVTHEKSGMGSPLMRPTYTVLDPTYTFSLPPFQTASGTADIFSHISEMYFGKDRDAYMLDRASEAFLKTCIKFGPIVMEDPENYVARANLFWVSEWAINGFLMSGKNMSMPACHAMQHPIGGFHNVTHGAALAVLTPHWMRYILNDDSVEKFAEYGVNVWDIDKNLDKYDIAKEAIKKTEWFFYEALGLPKTLRELGVDTKENFEAMAEMASRGLQMAFVPLSKEDVIKIYESAY